LFAKYGCFITASDQDIEEAKKQGWAQTGQHATFKAELNKSGLCDPEQFDQLVELKCVDMNKIQPELYGQYDFVWSSCSLEHLGSLKHGLNFIRNSLKCLKPGGIAVHTTEYSESKVLNVIFKSFSPSCKTIK
jgi:2-polyprenyl-3-methyl-5-hydroxy-6-metoxy-1,4-benzoquinol methylase